METIQQTLIERVAAKTGNGIYNCYQCQRCSSGCPAAEFMDYLPAAVIRMIQYGLEDKILSSRTIWVCSSCETCTTRCPNEVDIAMTMDVMREICVESGVQAAERNVLRLHRSFLSTIRLFGKMHELSLIAEYKLRSKRFFDDLKLGLDMFLRGKIKLIPGKIKHTREMRKILSKY